MQPELPSVAVIIPAYNAGRYLARAVRSVFSTGYPHITAIVVDDGSTDDTLQVAERLAGEFRGRCVVHRHQDRSNHGVGASRNLGVSVSDSDWLAFLDADDEYLGHRFDALRGAKVPSAEIDGIYDVTEMRVEDGGALLGPSDAAATPHRFGIDKPLQGASLLEALLAGRCWATSAILMKRSLFHRAGGFPEGQTIAEDCDLWFRIASIGRLRAGNLERPVSVYWRHGSNTYSYRHAHRLPLLVSMFRAWRWAGRQGCAPEVLKVFDRAVPRYLERSLLAAREAGQLGLAAQMLVAACVHRARSLAGRGVLKHAVRLPWDVVRRLAHRTARLAG